MTCVNSSLFSSSDHGDSTDSEVLWLRGAGEQRDVLSLRRGGDRRLPLCALAEPARCREGGPCHRFDHLQHLWCLVPHLPGQPTRSAASTAI